LFTRVAKDTGVPADLLAAVSWTETRWTFVVPSAESHALQYGPLALTDGGPRDLHRGASLAGVTDDAARTDLDASIRAGAALLRAAALAHGGDYHAALRIYGGDESFAANIEAQLERGIDAVDDTGHRLVVAARGPSDRAPGFSSVAQALQGYSGAEWVPAYSGNYSSASRGVGDIKYIIIHDTEGSYSGTLSWFQDPQAQVSAHYVVRSRDGHIAQMVDEKNIAWHVKCFNTNSVGIEHEGYAAKPQTWYTEAMYAESAKLTAYLADKYNIKKTHTTSTIMGHGEAPDCSDHTDPGPGWNWPHYMDLVQTGGAASFDWLSPARTTAVDAQTPAGMPGTFTFQIRGPEVRTPTVYDEAFSFVQEGVTWFGPTFHVVVKVNPAVGGGDGGCNAGGSGSTGVAGIVLALGLVIRRCRPRR
jgi:N-acetyl-anhydromuramyl-L-alanine amidase AmpD